MKFSSKYLEDAVEAFATLPGIGRKSALRLALHLLKQDGAVTTQFAEALKTMRAGIRECEKCHNLADGKQCTICADPRRRTEIICVVETVRDVMAIEETGQFRGVYHVLGGVISPLDGIGPSDLQIESLLNRIPKEGIQELIMAISPTIEGETTIYYIANQLKNSPVQVSTIARGVAFGGELEYADELTLGRSIITRIPYQNKQG